MSSNGTVKVGDMGLCRITKSTVNAQSFAGTQVYMSPETHKKQKYSFRTDIWSLGCVLYEMMTLKRAFHDRPVPGIDSPPYLDIQKFLNLNKTDSIFTPILLK